jgi:serine/threonine-protein kinase ATR
MFIQNFDAEVDVAASKAKPKTIYLTSTCGKHLQFLCKQEKHGDLRKDSRMMELNSVVNRLLTEDSEGRKRNLRLRTYAVVCLNEECGILEWVNNTTPLRKVIAESHTYYPLHFPMINKQEQQQQFTDNQMNNASNISKLTTFYREDFVCHTKPCLHRWYIHSFPDPTAWLEARNLFTHSAAVWSVVGHVVGLGDRHTENVLIDFTNGECVHVDFDCLFDKGLTLQRPEIVPFRLTANMIDAMGLLGVEGTFRRTMEVVMSLLRENRDTLLAVIEPFLRDPTVAWGRAGKAQRGEIVAAQKIGKDVPNMENADAKEALSKISGRLKGVYNLTHPHAKRIIEQYVKRKETPPLRGLGAQLDEALPLSVQGQVQRLIEEATADENLAQMYIGWQPWN